MLAGIIIGTYLCTGPDCWVEVNMEDKNATTWKTSVPPYRLAVFHEIVLIFISFITNQISTTPVGQRRHIGYRCRLIQFYGGEPSHQPAFMGRVASRLVTVTIVVASIHEVPAIHKCRSTIIKIGESKAMRIFMTDGAERTVIIISCQLIQGTVAIDQIVLITRRNGNGITIDALLAIFQVFTHPPLVGPYQVRSRRVMHAVTSIDNQQLVDIAVTVPVVFAPVDVECLQFVHDILNQILRVLIIRSSAGIFLGIADLQIHQVEDGAELVVTLVTEVVVHRTIEVTLFKILLIENLVPLFQRCSLAALEIPTLKGYHHHQLVEVTFVEVATREAFFCNATGNRPRSAASTPLPHRTIFCRCRQRDEQQQKKHRYLISYI